MLLKFEDILIPHPPYSFPFDFFNETPKEDKRFKSNATNIYFENCENYFFEEFIKLEKRLFTL